MNTQYENDKLLHLQEISQQEFCDHIEDDDFFLAYGNPLIINCDNGKKLVAIAWPLAERIMRAEGRGDEADEIIKRAAEMERFLQEVVDMTEYNEFYCGHWHIDKQDAKIRFLFRDIVMVE